MFTTFTFTLAEIKECKRRERNREEENREAEREKERRERKRQGSFWIRPCRVMVVFTEASHSGGQHK